MLHLTPRSVHLWHLEPHSIRGRSASLWHYPPHTASLSQTAHPLPYLLKYSWERHHKELPVRRDLMGKTKNKAPWFYSVCPKQSHATNTGPPGSVPCPCDSPSFPNTPSWAKSCWVKNVCFSKYRYITNIPSQIWFFLFKMTDKVVRFTKCINRKGHMQGQGAWWQCSPSWNQIPEARKEWILGGSLFQIQEGKQRAKHPTLRFRDMAPWAPWHGVLPGGAHVYK